MPTPALQFLWRAVVFATGLALLVAGLAVLAHSLDATGPLRAALGGGLAAELDLTGLPLRSRWVWAAGALALALTGFLVSVLALSPTTEQREQSKRVRLTGHKQTGLYGSGEVTVSIRSVYALVVHTAERDPAVREADPRLRLRRSGWHLTCRVVVTPDAELPAVAARLKTLLSDALERHTGLPVVRTDLDMRLFSLDAHRRVH